jgi:hypothetical protein
MAILTKNNYYYIPNMQKKKKNYTSIFNENKISFLLLFIERFYYSVTLIILFL